MRTCSKCGVEQPLTEFRARPDQPGKRYGTCNSCKRAYGRAHYAANKADYIGRSADRRKAENEKTYRKLIAYLSTHPCVDCGETDLLVLQFDHVDPQQKTAHISRLVWSSPWSRVLEEIRKCEVRCANCHRRRTLAQRRAGGLDKGIGAHTIAEPDRYAYVA